MNEANDRVIRYLNNAETWQPGGFMTSLAHTYYRADKHHRELLIPVMEVIMAEDPEYRKPRYRISVEDAQARIRADYQEDVTDIVDALKQAIKDGEVSDSSEVEDWLQGTVDGCGRVIYTGQAILGLYACDNQDAYVEEFGTDSIVVNGSINWPALMYAALMADVREELGDIEELLAEPDEADLDDE